MEETRENGAGVVSVVPVERQEATGTHGHTEIPWDHNKYCFTTRLVRARHRKLVGSPPLEILKRRWDKVLGSWQGPGGAVGLGGAQRSLPTSSTLGFGRTRRYLPCTSFMPKLVLSGVRGWGSKVWGGQMFHFTQHKTTPLLTEPFPCVAG